MSSSFTCDIGAIVNQLFTPVNLCLPYQGSNGMKPPTQVLQFKALWDTGATNTVISSNVVNALGLKPIGQIVSHHANGVSDVNTYLTNLILPNNLGLSFLQVSEGILSGFDVLIGMDVISKGDFVITNFEGRTMFSFRVPSSEKIDFVKPAKIVPVVPMVSRNSLCKCGSGKKYKQCHGK